MKKRFCFCCFFQINLGNNDALAHKHLNRVRARYKDNLLLNFAAARLSHDLGKNDYCLTVLKKQAK